MDNSAFWSDFKASLRSLRSNKGYAIGCILVLGLSLAVFVAVASIADGLVLKQPTASNPTELVFLAQDEKTPTWYSLPDYRDAAEQASAFAGFFAYDQGSNVAVEGPGGETETVTCLSVSGSFFPTLGATAAQGRTFLPEDDRKGAEPVAVISSRLSRQLGTRVGDMVRLNHHAFRVAGILPASFVSIDRRSQPDLWIPLAQLAAVHPAWFEDNRNFDWLRVGGRLASGTNAGEVQGNLARLGQLSDAAHPDYQDKRRLIPLSFAAMRLAEDSRARASTLLSGIVAATLALAVVNFFALTLVQLFSKHREVAVRIALGAQAGNLTRWFLIQAGVLLVLALLGGTAFAFMARPLMALQPRLGALIDGASVTLDARSLGLAVGLVVLGFAAVALFLRRQINDLQIAISLKESKTAPRSGRSFLALVATQVAIAVVLSTVAFAFLGRLQALASRPLPFRTSAAYTVAVDIRALGLLTDRERGNRFYAEVIERLRSHGSVAAVGGSNRRLLGGTGVTRILPDGVDRESDANRTEYSLITPTYFEALGMPILRGRPPTPSEVETAQPVALVSSTMARRFWGDETAALGQRFKPWADGAPATVVGVVGDIPQGASDLIAPRFYLPYTTDTNPTLHLVVALRDPSAKGEALIREALSGLFPAKAHPEIRPLSEQVRNSRGDLTLMSTVLAVIAGLSGAVTLFGMYSFSSYTATQGIRDLALRRALGARFPDLFRAQARRYTGGIAAGMLLGAVAVLWLDPLVGTLNLSLQTIDWKYLLASLVFLAGVTALGLFLPLARIWRLDPWQILSRE